MNQVEFSNWIIGKGISKKVCSDLSSRLKRIEFELGNIDIDDEYKKDKCKEVLDKFSNTGIGFKDTNLPYKKYTISTYKYALKKYIEFMQRKY